MVPRVPRVCRVLRARRVLRVPKVRRVRKSPRSAVSLYAPERHLAIFRRPILVSLIPLWLGSGSTFLARDRVRGGLSFDAYAFLGYALPRRLRGCLSFRDSVEM